MTEVDTEALTGVCAFCGPVRVKRKAGTAPGTFKYLCAKSQARWNGVRGRKDYVGFKGESCQRCGFVALHPAQLDVHHKDRDRTNNTPTNLETLCANCHRLEHAG